MSSFVRRSPLAVALLALFVFAFASSASAKTFVVTKKGDPNPGQCKANDCSLREAVIAANQHNGKDTISLPAKNGAYKLTRTPPAESDENSAMNGDLDLTGKTTVKHSGKGRATVDANGVDRAFDVLSGARSSFKKLIIEGGEAVGPNLPRGTGARGGSGPTPEGGGIRASATITVKSSVIKKNRSLQYGGGIGVVDPAGLNLINSTVTKNTSPSDGGGIDGGAGKMVIKHSKITANKANGNGGGMYFYSAGRSQIIDSTFSGNRASGDGGAIRDSSSAGGASLQVSGSTFSGNRAGNSGGAVFAASGSLGMSNSTISGNSAAGGGGGGISAGSGMMRGTPPPAKVRLNAVTIVGNKAANVSPIIQLLGGGLQNLGSASSFKVANSLVALNFSGTTRNDCSGAFASQGHNLLGTNGSCSGFDGPGDLVKPNPKVGKLKKNGGPTKTIALKKGSPAIGKAGQSSPSRDQRGHKRDNNPDIGAFER